MKSTLQIFQEILGEFDENSNTENALEIYINAKKFEAAAKAAIKLTQDFATQKLIENGGNFKNEIAKCHLKSSFQTEFDQDERRETMLAEIEKEQVLLKGYTDALAEIEKEMIESGKGKKIETGKSLSVTLLDKI